MHRNGSRNLSWSRGLRAGLIALLPLLVAGPVRAQEVGERTPRDLFKGKVTALDGRRITIEYDWTDPAQLEDWAEVHPFLQPGRRGSWTHANGGLLGVGNLTFRTRAVFDREVRLESTLQSGDAKNFGAVVLSEDSTTFTLFALADAYFTVLDKRAPLEHMVTTFKSSGAGPGGDTEWRYVETSYTPRVGGNPVAVTVFKRGAENDFLFGDGGRLKGRDVEASVGPRLAPGFYTIGSRVTVGKTIVSGVLDADWLRSQKVVFEDRVPEDPDAAPDPEPEPETGPPDDAGWRELATQVADASLDEKAREAAADALIELDDGWAARAMINLMYDDDDEVARNLGHKVFKALAKRDGGYHPRMNKDQRTKIMSKVWGLWYRLRTKLEKDAKDAKKKR